MLTFSSPTTRSADLAEDNLAACDTFLRVSEPDSDEIETMLRDHEARSGFFALLAQAV